CSDDSSAPPFPTELVDPVGELRFPCKIYEIASSLPLFATHPHIQRPLGIEGEPSLPSRQLVPRYAQVRQQPVQLWYRFGRQHFSHLRELNLLKLDLRRDVGGIRPRDFQTLAVPVAGNHPPARSRDASGVTAQA